MIPTYKQVKKAGAKTTLEKFVLKFAPAGNREEDEFREMLQTISDESFIKKRKKR